VGFKALLIKYRKVCEITSKTPIIYTKLAKPALRGSDAPLLAPPREHEIVLWWGYPYICHEKSFPVFKFTF